MSKNNPPEPHSWPKDVGILAIELYFPIHYVDQAELETFDKVSKGKYVIGLGQSKMGFCTDREDVNSLCLTVVERLMKKHNISYSKIGRLEVGSETILDKSKSIKSHLMDLFVQSGNSDVEGVDTKNACYGGTAALFNCLNWIESSYWDGRYALTVAADIAVYEKGNARCTGGAGAIAILLGPNAPIVFDRGLRCTHVEHVYDFYKPNLSSEYPIVDGKLSTACYFKALNNCYEKYKQKYLTKYNSNAKKPFTVNDTDAFLFHTPYCKLVQKSFARLVLNDVVSNNAVYDELNDYRNILMNECMFDKEIEKAAMKASLRLFQNKTLPSLYVAKEVGNMYTPSVYGGLVSVLFSKKFEDLKGLKIVMFSYGSGSVASMFSMRILNNGDEQTLKRLVDGVADVRHRLETRIKVEPESFDIIMKTGEENTCKAPFQPSSNINNFLPGTWYLENIDEKFRRVYKRIEFLTEIKNDLYLANKNTDC